MVNLFPVVLKLETLTLMVYTTVRISLLMRRSIAFLPAAFNVGTSAPLTGHSAGAVGRTALVANGCGRADCCQLLDGGSPSPTKRKHPWFPRFTLKPYYPNSELIYPPELARHKLKPLKFGDEYRQWLRPTTMEQLVQIMSEFPEAKLIGGSSEVQIEVNVSSHSFRRT
jgi:xanthine dehydrogenase/oxidase